MRVLLILFSALLPLAAQHYEGGRLYVNDDVYVPGEGMDGIWHGENRLTVMDSNGRSCVEPLPLEFQGRRGVCRTMAYRDGTLYAFGVLNHPLFDRVGDRHCPKTNTFLRDSMPRVLLRKMENGSWERLAILPNSLDLSHFSAFIPLAGNRFLVHGYAIASLSDGSRTHLAILAPDGRGGMQMEPLPGQGARHSRIWSPSSFQIVRIPGQILVLPKDGSAPMGILDEQTATLLESRQMDPLPKGMQLHQVAPTPDGRVLMTLRSGIDPESIVRKSRKSDFDSKWGRLVLANIARDNKPLQVHWAELDPSTGKVESLRSRTDLPSCIDAERLERFRVLPNGRVIITSSIQGDSLWRRLLPTPLWFLFIQPWGHR